MKWGLLLLVLAACVHPHGDDTDDEGNAVVVFHVDAPEAALWVDGRYIGPLAALRGGVALHPGHHRFEVRDDQHFSHYAELDLHASDRKVLDVHLAPILP